MKYNQDLGFRIFDSLINKGIRFALYRKPKDEVLHFILQKSLQTYSFNRFDQINKQMKGFLIAPFCVSEANPIILIESEIELKGVDAIFSFVKETILNGSVLNKQTISKDIDINRYKNTFKTFHDTLLNNEFDKLVLSRTFNKAIDENFSAGETFAKACNAYTDNFIYLCHTPETGTWLGCSPELLIAGTDHSWQTVALAGTRKTLDNRKEWDTKNKVEQHIVTNYMQQQLQKARCSYTQSQVSTIKSGNIEHLKTEFRFETKDSNSIGQLLDLLHPSPAICGFPKEKAYQFILDNEGYNRRYYSGFIGELNINQTTDLYVNLRCMQIFDDSLQLFAGGGILPSSTVESEWSETENKLQTILSII